MPTPAAPSSTALILKARDLVGIGFLLDEAKRFEADGQYVFSAITWLNAFGQLKHMRSNYGLPVAADDRSGYFETLAGLMVHGKRLLCVLIENDIDFPVSPTTHGDFQACVEAVESWFMLMELNLNKEDRRLFMARFGFEKTPAALAST